MLIQPRRPSRISETFVSRASGLMLIPSDSIFRRRLSYDSERGSTKITLGDRERSLAHKRRNVNREPYAIRSVTRNILSKAGNLKKPKWIARNSKSPFAVSIITYASNARGEWEEEDKSKNDRARRQNRISIKA